MITTKKRAAGRVAVDGATNVVRVNITLEPDQRGQLHELGGSAWVRGKLREAAAILDESQPLKKVDSGTD